MDRRTMILVAVTAFLIGSGWRGGAVQSQAAPQPRYQLVPCPDPDAPAYAWLLDTVTGDMWELHTYEAIKTHPGVLRPVEKIAGMEEFYSLMEKYDRIEAEMLAEKTGQ